MMAGSAHALLVDGALMSISNILIFSIWYWIIDHPGSEDEPREKTPWAFLLPQRGSDLPQCASWWPRYANYCSSVYDQLCVQTDALPLTRTAKMLMLLHAASAVSRCRRDQCACRKPMARGSQPLDEKFVNGRVVIVRLACRTKR